MARSRKTRPKSSEQRQQFFHPEFLQALRYWIETYRKIALRALTLVEAASRDPFQGIRQT